MKSNAKTKVKAGIILNDDFGHFFASRHKYKIDITKEVVEEYIDQYIGTQVSAFCLNVNASLSYSPSEVFETVFDKFLKTEIDGTKVDYRGTYLETAYDTYVNKGLDVHGIMFKRLRENGIGAWLSFRMNDLHGFKDKLDSRTSDFRAYAFENSLCRTTHRPHTDYFDACFDFSKAAVRDRIMAYLVEQLDNYDVDGIELDFLREVFCFKVGEEREGREIINNMLRELKQVISNYSKLRKHDIGIMVRVPSNPVQAYDMGLDFYTWKNEGLVDVVIASPRFNTCDSNLPMESWLRIFEGSGTKAVGGIELYSNPVPGINNPSFCNTPEMLNGYAVSYLSAGTDNVYLYNYFDDPGLQGKPEVDTMSFSDEEITVENHRDACAQAMCYITNVLKTVGSLKTCVNLPRRHILTYCDISPKWIVNSPKLPMLVKKYDYLQTTLKTEYVSIETGPIPEEARIYLVAGLKNSETGETLTVWCNNEICTPAGETKIFPDMSEGSVFIYEIPVSAVKDYRQVFEFSAAADEITVDYLEVRIFSSSEG